MPSASRNLVRSASYSSPNSEKCGAPSNSIAMLNSTQKIDNIAIYAVLSAELLAEKLPSLKVFPQDRFSRSAVVSQLLASIS